MKGSSNDLDGTCVGIVAVSVDAVVVETTLCHKFLPDSAPLSNEETADRTWDAREPHCDRTTASTTLLASGALGTTAPMTAFTATGAPGTAALLATLLATLTTALLTAFTATGAPGTATLLAALTASRAPGTTAVAVTALLMACEIRHRFCELVTGWGAIQPNEIYSQFCPLLIPCVSTVSRHLEI